MNRPSILIVDDEIQICYALKEGLAGYGFNVETALDGAGAIQLLLKNRFDVVVADIVMPEMDGLTLLGSIREKFDSAVILMTGFTERFNYEKAIESGASDFIDKPIQIAELALRIRRVLRENALVLKLRHANDRLSLEIEERKKAEAELRESQNEIIDIFQNSSDFLFAHDLEGNFTKVNTGFLTELGYTADEMQGSNVVRLLPEKYRGLFPEYLREVLRKGSSEGLMKVQGRNGEERIVEYKNSVVYDMDENPVGIRGSARDVTDKILAMRRLEEAERRFAQVVENAREWVWEIDTRGLYTYSSRVVEEILGYRIRELVGKICFYDLFHPEDKERLKKEVLDALSDKRPFKNFESRNIHKNGKTVWLSTSGVPIPDRNGRLKGYRGVTSDISDQKELLAELERLSYIDELTQVANRRYFLEIMEMEWRRAIRYHSPISLIFADVDCFKAYNDTLGHSAGDRCLKNIASAMKNSVRRPGDIVARYGGEEFMVILPNTEIAGSITVAEAIKEAIKKLSIPHPGSCAAPFVTLSMGCSSVVPSLGMQYSSIIDSADKALYKAKENGRNRIQKWPPD